MDFKKYRSNPDEVSQDKRYKNFSTQLLPLEEKEKADVVIKGVPYDPGTSKHVAVTK